MTCLESEVACCTPESTDVRMAQRFIMDIKELVGWEKVLPNSTLGNINIKKHGGNLLREAFAGHALSETDPVYLFLTGPTLFFHSELLDMCDCLIYLDTGDNQEVIAQRRLERTEGGNAHKARAKRQGYTAETFKDAHRRADWAVYKKCEPVALENVRNFQRNGGTCTVSCLQPKNEVLDATINI